MDHATDTAPANVEKVTPPAEHTPGPWCTVDQHFNRSAIHICKAGPFGNEIATLYHAPDEDDSQDSEGVWRDDPVRMANARLIAAAPDLLEALTNLVMDAQQYDAWARPCHAIDVANAAIAKARGIPPDP